MKKLIIFTIVLSMSLAACSPKEESPEPKKTSTNTTGGTGGGTGGGGGTAQPALTVTSAKQGWFKLDGTVVHYINGTNGFSSVNDLDTTIDGDSTTAVYYAGVQKLSSLESIDFTRGELTYLTTTPPSAALFSTLFGAATYPFQADITEISYSNSTGIWSTTGGSQTGSVFQIVGFSSTGTTAIPRYTVLIKFNCKVYNILNPSQSKTITEGIAVVEFSSQ